MIKIIKYAVSSGVATLLDVLFIWFLTSFLGIYYLISTTISFTLISLANYLVIKNWVFYDRKESYAKNYLLFLIIGVVGLIWTLALMFTFVEFVGINYLIARILAAFLVLIWNFFMNKKFTFS
ncbi:MAG: GtrA family protein [Nanoarchaeota archaeon]|nr:GtrA family protein [Nanoarchaeota archaeon]